MRWHMSRLRLAASLCLLVLLAAQAAEQGNGKPGAKPGLQPASPPVVPTHPLYEARVLPLWRRPRAAGPAALDLAETMALAGNMSFSPILACAGTLAAALLDSERAAFLGPLQQLQTGDVLQAFYRVPQRDCNSSASSSGTDKEEGGASASGSGSGSNSKPPLVLLPPLGAAMSAWGPDVLARLSCYRELVVMENRGVGLSVDYSKDALATRGYYAMAGALGVLREVLGELCALGSGGCAGGRAG